MSAHSQNCGDKGRPFLGNGSANTFPLQPNHVTAARDAHAAIEELLEAVFLCGPCRCFVRRSKMGNEFRVVASGGQTR
jgi:hypothetical protein